MDFGEFAVIYELTNQVMSGEISSIYQLSRVNSKELE